MQFFTFKTQTILYCFFCLIGNLNLLRLLRGLTKKFKNLNLYFSRYKSSTITLPVELFSTRMYLVLWSLIFSVLILYNCLSPNTVITTIDEPDEATCEELQMNFKSSLQCPCSQAMFPYGSFVKITAQLHQICSSPFIEAAWIESIFADGNWYNTETNQFLGRGVEYFLVQKYLCYEAQLLLDGNINQALSFQIRQGKLLPKKQIFLQAQKHFDNMKRQTEMNFITGTLILRAEIQINQLINIFSTSWTYALDDNRHIPYYRISTKPVSHGPNCSCAISSACTEPIFVENEMIPGFVLGCSPLESLLRSTLVCLYNQTCVDLINVGNVPFINILDVSIPSEFSPNTTVEEMARNVFLEKLLVEVSYSDYFSHCQPLSCTYLMLKSQSGLQLISVILSLYGGLTLTLYSITGWLAKTIFLLAAKIRPRDNAVHPFT